MSDDPNDLQRRSVLGLLAAAPLAGRGGAAGLVGGVLGALAPAVPAAAPTPVVTVLYRRESAQAPSRLEPVTQAATLALENEFVNRGFRVIQPAAEIYQLLDQGQGVVITFAEDAGFSLVFSTYADMRPSPGQEGGIAEVRLATRVYVGRNILVAEEGRGRMFTRLEAGNREFGMRRAMELAAQRAAAEVADKAARQLQSLTPERISQLVGSKPTGTTTASVVPIPAPGQPPVFPGAAPAGQPGMLPVLPPGAAAPGTPMPAPPPAPGAPGGMPSLPPSAPPTAPTPMAPPVALTPAGGKPEGLPPPRERWALVIGMSDYSSVRAASGVQIGDLPGVARDTQFVLGSLGKMGFAKERLTVLRDQQATGIAIRGALKDMAGKVGTDDVVLIFISGHGGDKDFSVSGYGMPILADYKPNDPSPLDFWELQSFAKNLRGKVLWINDTCHSGGAAKDVATVVISSGGVSAQKDVRGPDAQTVAGSAGPGQDFAILTACRANEISWEEATGGVFTTKLFTDLVANGGKLPVSSIYAGSVVQHVVEKSKTMCRTGNMCGEYPQQTPVMAYNGRGHLIRI